MDCIVCQAPLAMGFSRQEYWRGLPLPSPSDLPDPEIEPGFPALQVDCLLTELWGKPPLVIKKMQIKPHWHTISYPQNGGKKKGRRKQIKFTNKLSQFWENFYRRNLQYILHLSDSIIILIEARNKKKMPFVSLILRMIVAVLVETLRKRNVKYKFWKGRAKFSLFSDDVLVSREISKIN